MLCNSVFIEYPAKKGEGTAPDMPAPLFRRTFEIKEKPQKAILRVCGLGYGIYYINGIRATEDRFIAPVSDYNKTLWYNSYDITDRLIIGKNVLSVMLGNGFYNEALETVWHFHLAPWRSCPKLILELELDFTNSTQYVRSDEHWKCDIDCSPIRYNQLRSGEIQDLRISDGWKNPDFNDSSWKQVRVSECIPSGSLRECLCQPIREKREYDYISVFKNKLGQWVLDFGQNMSGYLRMSVNLPTGTRITIRYAEEIDAEGLRVTNGMDNKYYYASSEFQTDSFISSGKQEIWSSQFVYHGFRYTLIEGLVEKPSPSSAKAVFVCQAVDEISEFSCSDDTMNKLYEMGKMSTLSNLFYMVTDCPTREKLGWCNDARASAEQMLQNFEISPLLKKWLQDIYDSMREDGSMSGIVPTSGWGYDWGSGPISNGVLFEIPYRIYRYLGETEPLIESLPFFKRYLAFADSKADVDGLVGFGLCDWAGPFASPMEAPTPVKLSDTVLMVEFHRVCALSAELSGDTITKQNSLIRMHRYERALKSAFLDTETGVCKTDEQTAVSMFIVNGIYERLEPLKNQLKRLVIKNDYHHNCGMLGMQYIYRALDICGFNEIAYRIITAKGRPSYREWIDNGATAMWEMWNTGDSKNHHMYSGVLSWFTNVPVGLRLNNSDNAYENAIISPVFLSELTYCQGSYITHLGKFSVSWQRGMNRTVNLEIEIPDTATASIKLSGFTLSTYDTSECKLNGGKYSFTCVPSEKDVDT